ncbi:TcdA/TcdB catalytic glycosyltransferase domain-containing protein [Vibrio ostreicida]|uniref:Glycosyltransferase n=1 Tax=Vibrio ostreicida TaxID=526588 RepID=A0ABT8BZD2_9VIBR|nr:TcdA/TcdB catalytic glycosyltransferase domain-containing protein [Vibrio ostreicida]MDN3612043.1 glycosyltransferase [Vibrio ostreicida]NPD08784.1 hypothetical protein [Vibrio ostreicida]
MSWGVSLNYPKKQFRSLPKQVHMIWVASLPEEAQLNPVRDWAQKNPSATINLWVDSKHFDAHSHYIKAHRVARCEVSGLGKKTLLRTLTHHLNVSLQQKNLAGIVRSIRALNKALGTSCREFRQAVLREDEQISVNNVHQVLNALTQVIGNNRSNVTSGAKPLRHGLPVWDPYSSGGVISDLKRLSILRDSLKLLRNVQVRDLSDTRDIRLKNPRAYQYEMLRGASAYPHASGIVKYDILYQYGGIYIDVDLTCQRRLDFGCIQSHPELMLVGIVAAKKAQAAHSTPCFFNALLACHRGSHMVKEVIDDIGHEYETLKGSDLSGTHVDELTHRAMIGVTDPDQRSRPVVNAFNQTNHKHTATFQRLWDKARQINPDVWQAVNSHLAFPDGWVEFSMPEQAKRVTEVMADPIR